MRLLKKLQLRLFSTEKYDSTVLRWRVISAAMKHESLQCWIT